MENTQQWPWPGWGGNPALPVKRRQQRQQTTQNGRRGFVRLSVPDAWNDIAEFVVHGPDDQPMDNPRDYPSPTVHKYAIGCFVWLALAVAFTIPAVILWAQYNRATDFMDSSVNVPVNPPSVAGPALLSILGVICWIGFLVCTWFALTDRHHRRKHWDAVISNVYWRTYLYVPSIDEMIDRYSTEYDRPLTGDEINVISLQHGEFVRRADQAAAQARHNEHMAALNGIAMLGIVGLLELHSINRKLG